MSKLFLLENSGESQVEPAVQSNELDTRNIVTLQVSFIFSILDSTFKLKDILIKDPMGSKLAKENLFKFINVKNKLKDINSFTVMQLGPVQYKTMLLKKNVELVIEAEVDYCIDGEDSKLKLGGKVEDLRPLNVYYKEKGNNKNMKEYYKQKTRRDFKENLHDILNYPDDITYIFSGDDYDVFIPETIKGMKLLSNAMDFEKEHSSKLFYTYKNNGQIYIIEDTKTNKKWVVNSTNHGLLIDGSECGEFFEDKPRLAEFFKRYDKNARIYLDKSLPENFRHGRNLKEANETNFSVEVLNKELETALYPILDKWTDYMELNQWLSIIKDTIIKYDRTH